MCLCTPAKQQWEVVRGAEGVTAIQTFVGLVDKDNGQSYLC